MSLRPERAGPVRRVAPRVHAAWTATWWSGDAALEALFGPPPSPRALELVAARLAPPARDWTADLELAPGALRPPADALVVLAGQQPVLAGGPALVAHKAATAVALARRAQELLARPVVPVFLLADEDHDTDEVDHVDVLDPRGGLRRVRCPLRPRSAPFAQAAWDEAALRSAVGAVAGADGAALAARLAGLRGAPAAAHVAELLLDALGAEGLACLPAHRLSAAAPQPLALALEDPAWARAVLADGAARLAHAGLRPAFEDDARPLVLETRAARRRRVAADDTHAARRRSAQPGAFSPHAALRPLVQAAALPVLAQVCGPSELLYLAQARGLHARPGLAAPLLVPRLEATRVPAARLPGGGLQALDLDALLPRAHAPAAEERALLDAARRLAQRVAEARPELAPRARRWLAGAERGARRLAAAPHWHGAGVDALLPRGRPQDTVLAWLPDAWRGGDPAAWGRHVVGLCRPLDPPAHVLHVTPEDTDHG